MGIFELNPEINNATKQTREILVKSFDEFSSAEDDDHLTLCIQVGEDEFRCGKCDQRIGRDQNICPACKRTVSCRIWKPDYDFYKLMKDNGKTPDDVEIKITRIKERDPFYYFRFFVFLMLLNWVVQWIVALLIEKGIL